MTSALPAIMLSTLGSIFMPNELSTEGTEGIATRTMRPSARGLAMLN